MPKHKPNSQAGEPKAKKARFKSTEEDEGSDDDIDRSQNADFTGPLEGREAEYGIIEKVSVKNFICHGRLDCNFGPNVNFVVGRNGSGKSAILTAIVVGLGGKAIATNRGNSVKSFIKDRKSVAEICVKLRNRGEDAYKPDEYGSSIIVERRLRREGGTAYKLKSDSGRVISTKREELTHILDHFNIQVDNPVSILNQETSKTFLLSKNSKDKYKFFLKATQLEQVSNDYSEILEHKRITADSVNKEKEKLPDLQKEVLDLEQKFKDLTCLQDLTEKRQDLIHQAAWAQVAEVEKERDNARGGVTKEENRVPKFDEKIEIQQVKVIEAEQKHAQIQSEVEALRCRLEELSPQYDSIKDSRQQLKQSAKSLEKEIKGLNSQIRNLESDMQDILQRIQDEKARDKAQFEKERSERERKVTDLLNERQDCEAQQQNAAREMDQFTAAVNGAKEQSYGLKSREGDINQTINASRRRLDNLEGSKKNRLTLYGDYIPAVLAEINRCAASRQFHQKPLGPIGAHLRLSDVHWALGVEACLKSLIYSFCCHDQHDTQALKRIMNRVIPPNTRQPSIITAKFETKPYDISRAAVMSDHYPSFLDVVNVDDPVIFNTLVDQRAVENILLIESSKDARPYLRDSPPRNCREAFTKEGDHIFAGAEQRFYSSMQKKARILQGDIDLEIRETQRELKEHMRALDQARQDSQRLKQTITENEDQRRRTQKQRIRMQDKISKINMEITQLENEGEAEEVTNVADLEEEVQQMETQVNGKKDKVERLSKNFKLAHQQLEEATKEYNSIDAHIQDISEQVDPLKVDLAQASIDVQTAKQHRKHYDEKKKDLMKNIADLKKGAEKKQKKVDEAISKAIQIYRDRIKVTRRAHNIDSEINQLTKRIEKEQHKQGDPVVITQQFHDAKQRYDTIKKQINSMTKFVKKLDVILSNRYNAFMDFRRTIANRTKYYFIVMMSTRGYHGQLKFDHKNEDLTLTVDPAQNDKPNNAAKDVRSLSGGERSFSTVCLIMALWESMESPFRAMDEFDVFMDMMNRKISIELMLQFAKDQATRQFIFLTPQDMSKISPSPFVRIQRLHDPERNQSYLTEASQHSGDDDEWYTEA